MSWAMSTAVISTVSHTFNFNNDLKLGVHNACMKNIESFAVAIKSSWANPLSMLCPVICR